MMRLWLCTLLSTLLLGAGAAEAQQSKLRASVQVAATDPFLGTNLLHFKEEVERQSGNAITVEIFDNGKLYNDQQVVDAVASGKIEMGVASLSQFSKQVPAIVLLQQPFLFNFEALVRASTSPDGEIRQLMDKAVLDSVGVRILWWLSFGSAVIVSRGVDVRDPQRIKKQKIRVFSDAMAQLTKLCGGTPAVLSSSKMHDALKDGTVDMVMTGIGAVETRQLWKVADTITQTDHAALEFSAIINEKTWQSLSDDHRSMILSIGRKVESRVRQQVSDLEAKAYAFAREKGMTVRQLTPDEIAEWRACSSDVLDDYMSNAGDLVRPLMAAYGKLRTDPCCSAGPGEGVFSRR